MGHLASARPQLPWSEVGLRKGQEGRPRGWLPRRCHLVRRNLKNRNAESCLLIKKWWVTAKQLIAILWGFTFSPAHFLFLCPQLSSYKYRWVVECLKQSLTLSVSSQWSVQLISVPKMSIGYNILIVAEQQQNIYSVLHRHT